MLRGKDATLAAIINIILDEEPETQDDIADSARYIFIPPSGLSCCNTTPVSLLSDP